ncbi:hypothetical protein [Vibrio sp. OPT20]|uniref:hypothetical protein n=1 Tax=Vibrio sp. OPT20 TaxID=2778642 RepID=UPI00187F69A2|nr:hypothetical protein [Vibrio sp. OPT20]MBE8566502.1 hypothetical protein [Vibrio sp. OPT20]
MSLPNNPHQQLEQAIKNIVLTYPVWISSEELAEIVMREMHLESYFFEKYFRYSRAKAVYYTAMALMRNGTLH